MLTAGAAGADGGRGGRVIDRTTNGPRFECFAVAGPRLAVGLALVVGLAVPIAQALANFRCVALNNLTESLAHLIYSIFRLGPIPAAPQL